MSRILLLAVFFVWIAWYPALAAPVTAPQVGVLIFLSGFAAIIVFLGLWSRWTSGRISSANFHQSLGRFNKFMAVGRVMVPLWLAAGMYLFHWHDVVEQGVDSLINLSPVFALLRLPAIFAGTLPAFLAWAGLWWSQYPSDRSCTRTESLAAIGARHSGPFTAAILELFRSQSAAATAVHLRPDFSSHSHARRCRRDLVWLFAHAAAGYRGVYYRHRLIRCRLSLRTGAAGENSQNRIASAERATPCAWKKCAGGIACAIATFSFGIPKVI